MAQEGEVNSEHINGDNDKIVSIASFKAQLVLLASKMDEAVHFYKESFGAEELYWLNNPKCKAEQDLLLIIWAERKISTTLFLVCDQTDDYIPTVDSGSSKIIFRLEIEDVAGMVAKAPEVGAIADGEITELEGACSASLLGKVKDPFGIVWIISFVGKKSCVSES